MRGAPRRAAAPALLLAVLLVVLLAGCSTTVTTGGAPSQAPVPVAPAVGAGTPGTGVQPNILLVETDDMRADELRWLPQTRARLLDGPGGGLSWESSFAPNPLCCPSRASMLTGRYSHNHGVLSHQDPWGFQAFDDRSTLATALQQVGYRTGLVGKYLNGYGEQPTRQGEDSLTYVPPGWTAWRGLSDHLWGPFDDLAGGTYDYENPVVNVDGDVVGFPGEYSTDLTGDQTRDLVRRFARPRPDGTTPPWFVWWTPIAPHHGTPVEDDDPGDVERDDGYETNFVTPAVPDRVRGRFDDEIDHALGTPSKRSAETDRSDKPRFLRQLPELNDEERDGLTEVTRQRAEALSVLDDELARTLDLLDARGLADDTLVVLTSDNGYYLGEHLKRQGKINLHEPSIRVPLLMRGPGVPPGERFDPVTTLDVATTLAAWAGATLDRPDGVDLRDVVAGGDQGWTRPVVLEGLMPEERYLAARASSAWSSRLDTVGVRTGRWKLVRYPTGEIEVYDLWTDPLELDALGRDDGDAATQRARRQLKRLWKRVTGCAEDACRAALPPDLVTTAEQVRDARRDQVAATERYYR